MLYAILAYHVESDVTSWTPEEDAALMTDLMQVRERLVREGRLGPSARLGETRKARTLRGPGNGMVIDGPFSRNQGAVARLLHDRLRQRRGRRRSRARPASRESVGGLRDPADQAVSAGRGVSGDGGVRRRWRLAEARLRPSGYVTAAFATMGLAEP